jgi:hypothetical protein
MKIPYVVLFLILLNSFLLIACGQGTTPTETPLAQISPTPIQTEIPAATSTPEAVATTTQPLAEPTPAASTASVPTPEPTATPTPSPSTTTVDSYGFTLRIDGSIKVENSGLLAENPQKDDGIIFFEYEGANSTLLWLNESKPDELLSDIYTQLVDAQPELIFSLINQGSVTVDSREASFLSFVSNTSTGHIEGGGLTAAWECPNQTVYSLTVTGSDPVVLQIRFKRLLDGFTCN